MDGALSSWMTLQVQEGLRGGHPPSNSVPSKPYPSQGLS
jgi:hypothetical protein